jgi:hypothetical protein
MSGGRDDTRATARHLAAVTGAVLLVLTIALTVVGVALLFGGVVTIWLCGVRRGGPGCGRSVSPGQATRSPAATRQTPWDGA